jgi:hypothetical protein
MIKEYAEDMMMMCVYFGVHIFPDQRDLIWVILRKEILRILLYRFDQNFSTEQKRLVQTPTIKSSRKFLRVHELIEYEADEENHVELLEECRDFGGLKKCRQ